jgi:HAD superfamily hydrolase (TIGR01549 family)
VKLEEADEQADEPSRQQLVLFDLDNTLADRDAAFSRSTLAFAVKYDIGEAGIQWLLEQDDDGLRPRRDFFAAVKDHFCLPGDIDDLLSSYRAEYPRCYEREDVSVAVLTALHRLGFKVAVVTNGEPSQADKVRLVGIADVVDAVCISSVVGARKPATAIFAEAARQCQGPLSGWMVGDSPEADIRGGSAGGADDNMDSAGSRVAIERCASGLHGCRCL